MCTHGHYGNLNNNKVFEFISDQKKAYEEINKIVSQKEFDYLLDNSQKFKNKIKEDDIKYMKFIFDELKQYCDDIEKKTTNIMQMRYMKKHIRIMFNF